MSNMRVERLAEISTRWAISCSRAAKASETLREAVDDLRELQAEFKDWRDSIHEICDVDLNDFYGLEETVADIQSLELPTKGGS
jgi:hypothetical protein